jgi:hypothetical protein
MTVPDTERQGRRSSSLAVRIVVGAGAFSWAAFVIFDRVLWPKPHWPLHLLGGAVFGAAATIVSRNAAQRALGRVLAALGYVSVGAIGAVLLQHSGDCVYVEFLPGVALPLAKFKAVTLLPIPLWLFLSSRAVDATRL